MFDCLGQNSKRTEERRSKLFLLHSFIPGVWTKVGSYSLYLKQFQVSTACVMLSA